MPIRRRPALAFRPGLSFTLLVMLLGALWLAGGASRADVPGQVVVRAVAWVALAVAALAGPRLSLRGPMPVAILLAATVALPLVQLVPLPPGLWQALPGRAVFLEAAAASGQAQPWRPWSIVPDATVNAAASLVVPVAILVLLTGLGEGERRRLPGLMLVLVTASMLVGLLQFSGAGVDNPFINDTPGDVSGMFANRNHFALFLALGCLMVPAWVFAPGRRPDWRGPVGLGLVLLFALTILASGSRAGLVLGLLALVIALVMVRREVRHALGRHPRWVFPAAVAGLAGLVGAIVLASVAADRAVSIDRLLAIDQGTDMRVRGLPTVWAMIRAYFPWGSGLGGFDPVFRLHEPFALLKLTYFNHAHNDMLEVVLEAGLAGLVVLLCALGWWMSASVKAWRAGAGARPALAGPGSAMLLLILIASAVDYPARTPMIMACIVLAATWLAAPVGRAGPALPPDDQHL